MKFVRYFVFIVTVVLFSSIYLFFFRKHKVGSKIYIESGKSPYEIVSLLQEKNVLNYPLLAKLFLRISNVTLKAGCYNLRGNLSDREIFSILEKGSFCPLNFTIVEGYNIFDVANVLSSEGLCNEKNFLSMGLSDKFLKVYDLEGKTLEGYLFPDTYEVDRKSSCKAVIFAILENFKKKTSFLFNNYVPSSLVSKAFEGNVTLYNILKVASIVEKETSVPSEKPIIAGIIYRRLIKGMPLQCDPTVIYAYRLKGKKVDILKGSDIRKIDSPYNTYRYKGLPPTPICNPGIESIRAALYPENSEYLYFFAVNGRHIFSKTYREHLRKMKKYYNIRE